MKSETSITTDVVVIGAGPAGLSCVIKLLDKGFSGSIILIDQGRKLKSRICPVDSGNHCNSCGGTCNVISGIGGCLHYGDAAKLSWFPSGRRLYTKLGYDKADNIASWCSQHIFNISKERYIGTDSSITPRLSVKNYNIARYNELEVKSCLDNIENIITENNNVQLLLGYEVIELDKEDGIFTLESSHRVYKDTIKITSPLVVVATGRKGLFWWKHILYKLNIKHKTSIPSIGLRFEMPKEYLQKIGQQHPDFKISHQVNGTKVKTFCLCAGHSGGRVKYTDYGKFVILDGHLIEHNNEKRNFPANIALLSQLKDDNGIPYSFEKIMNELIPLYAFLSSEDKPKPIVQWYSDFAKKRLTMLSVEDISNICGFKLSVNDLRVADVSKLIPKKIHDAFTSTISTLMNEFSTMDNAGYKLLSHDENRIAVIGLELEGLWDEIEMNNNSFESSLKGLYVIGDTAGIAQGILQASVSGAAAAEEIYYDSYHLQ